MFFLFLLDTDCSGRMLATVLIAWVTTAMIASILLQWEHMWIVLVILTVVFFLVCGYTIYTVKKTHARILIEQQRAAIRTISDITANRSQTGSMTSAVRLTPDLPPPYASVVTVQETSPSASGIIEPPGENKFEDPPPYSIAIAYTNNVQERNAEAINEQHPPVVSTEKGTVSTISGLASASHTCLHPR